MAVVVDVAWIGTEAFSTLPVAHLVYRSGGHMGRIE